MFRSWRKAIEEELSGRQAYRYAERIGQYHRIQASPGYREAANQIMNLLKRDGVEAELVTSPARFGDRFLSHQTFKEWRCDSAELWIETPVRKRIARFEEEEISLIQRSISTLPEGVTTGLIVIDNATEESSYEGLDVEGKIALVRGNPAVVHALAVEKYKATGLIFDHLAEYPPFRTRLDLPDTRQYTSYWWHAEEEVKSFGFVVSPRIGEELRNLAKDGEVLIKAKVKTELYEGQFENIEYFIPGKKHEELLLVSHLCHPYPGGQDNASGPGTLMEVMRTLTRLIQDGTLPQPELGIRFLMMPEMNGTAAYFHQHPDRIEQTVAALNLDMVGADQTKGGGPLCVEQPPLATPTFVDRFAYHLVEDVMSNSANFSGTTKYSTVNYVKTRFSGGSDHYIISDPTIGIPCPMLIQWPDKHYHTTSDLPQHLDETMMEKVGVVTALYGYGLANGGEEDWISYLFQHTSRSSNFLISEKEWLIDQSFSTEEKLQAFSFYTDYETKAIKQIENYAKLRNYQQLLEQIDWTKQTIAAQNQLLEVITKKHLELTRNLDTTEFRSEDWMTGIYTRTYKAPLRIGDEISLLSLDERLNWHKEYESKVPMGYADFLFYWMDGKRTVEEVLTLTRYETGYYYPEYAKALVDLCLQLRLIA
ncbi:DUF4910 domain-containing protein [Anaerobacillus isosaccharinicus]|uniref:DUF4910 domain-containing protein n=1 Tax=Anaerobacillus isosaccharinicus TaxID=1532552 RepID=A0A1S2LHC2_9BACI|nr:DUF4910 domain-containing protein [Anaerobacillus isosaccharinicus]MBA5586606.1 DUF4910 domain-containing protein [Anaerobacillus isosaccharinicus]QOY35159.1 DUF4910 domain-containing protein [Anaerobacillus isosaccharinicus]